MKFSISSLQETTETNYSIMKIVNLTPENAEAHSFFCIKNNAEPGFKAKHEWFTRRFQEGLKLKLIYADDKKLVGFIEYVPAEFAWRPVRADGYLFIHCIFVYPNKYRSSGAASDLIKVCIDEASEKGLNGVCVMTSQGPWMATKKLFSKQGFSETDSNGRFELMTKKLKGEAPDPKLIHWEEKQEQHQGWSLMYADQCPWHAKGVNAIEEVARSKGIELKITKIETAEQARQMPSGFGVFALVKDGKLIADHYISKTRFENILRNESQDYPNQKTRS